MLKLKLRGQEIDMTRMRIMGVLDLKDYCAEELDEYVEDAAEMEEQGAEFIEIGISTPPEELPSVEPELNAIVPFIKGVAARTGLLIAVNTSNPEVMRQAVAAGACMVADPNALRLEGAIKAITELKVPVCLGIAPEYAISEEDENVDPMGRISEYFYERIDACLNARIPRSAIMIDPCLGISTPFEYRLKMFGRLKTFKSFALPIALSIPRSLPHVETYPEQYMPVMVASCLFAEEAGISLIRTPLVQEIALALDTWQAMKKSARPFRLRKAIAKHFWRRRHQRKGQGEAQQSGQQ